jgi:hypothetical protein
MFAIQYGNWTANRVMSDILCWRFSATDGAFGGLNDDQAGPLPPDYWAGDPKLLFCSQKPAYHASQGPGRLSRA